MLSIIVPVYNVERYIQRCVESVCAQEGIDFELILIDDGSKDKSPAICDRLANNDKRICVVHQENGGVSSARNKGLDIAHGEYVMFVDSDDWIEPDFCKELMTYVKNADFVVGGYSTINKSGIMPTVFSERTFYFPEGIETIFDELYHDNFFNAPFSKVYRSSIIGNQRFDRNVALGEDFLFNLEYLSKCRTVAVVDAIGYNYNCMNSEAATKRLREGDIEQIVFLYQKGKQFLQSYCPSLTGSKEMRKRLCLNGLNLIQLICYSQRSQSEKYTLVKKLLGNTDFIEACKEDYSLPIKYNLPRWLCVENCWGGLQCFFWWKKRISAVKDR